MAFLVLVAPKALESDPEHHHLHARHARAQELQEELTCLLEPDVVQELAMQGLQLQVREGGVAAILGGEQQQEQSGALWIAGSDERIAVFQGQLKNLQQLEAKYLTPATTPHEAAEHLPPLPETHVATLSVGEPPEGGAKAPGSNGCYGTAPGSSGSAGGGGGAGSSGGCNPAAVVLAMYESVGASLLGQLQGRFSLCMFDALQMRVLAARDGSGAVPLAQARTPRGGLVLSTCVSMLACCHDMLAFDRGFFKYGWLAAPRLFTPQALQHPTSGHSTPRRSLDLHHHNHPAHPLHAKDSHGAGGSAAGSRRTSLEHQQHPQLQHGHMPASADRGAAHKGAGGGGSGGGAGGAGAGGRGQGQGSRRSSTDTGAVPLLPTQCGDRHKDAQGNTNHSPSRSTGSNGSGGHQARPRTRADAASKPPSGDAAEVMAAGTSHLRVEAAPFIPNAASK